MRSKYDLLFSVLLSRPFWCAGPWDDYGKIVTMEQWRKWQCCHNVIILIFASEGMKSHSGLSVNGGASKREKSVHIVASKRETVIHMCVRKRDCHS